MSSPLQHFLENPEACVWFMAQRDLTFKLQPSTFSSEQAKITYVLTLLSGKAFAWETKIWNAEAACCTNYFAFVK